MYSSTKVLSHLQIKHHYSQDMGLFLHTKKLPPTSLPVIIIPFPTLSPGNHLFVLDPCNFVTSRTLYKCNFMVCDFFVWFGIVLSYIIFFLFQSAQRL